MQHVETDDAIELLFLIVQADDGPRLFRVLRANAAEIDDVRHARFLDCSGEGIGNSFLMIAQILVRNIFRQHEIDSCRALESFGHRSGIFHVADERFRALLHERLKLFRVAADRANFFTFCEQRFRRRPSRVSCSSYDYDHEISYGIGIFTPAF